MVSVDPRTGGITFGNQMMDVYLESSYDRKKDAKRIYRIPQVNKDMSFDPDAALLKNFDFLSAVDTNTRIIREKEVSVTGIIIAKWFRVARAHNIEIGYRIHVPFLLEFVSIRHHLPENLGWIRALQELTEQGFIDTRMRVGLIVDSDLGNLNDYNHRRKPVFDNAYLPENTQLIYASADTGKDSVVNKALGDADTVARRCLDAIETGLAPFNSKQADNPWYEGFRLIKPNPISR